MTRFLIITITLILHLSCKDDVAVIPKVNSDEVYSGRAGEIITVLGSDFNALPSNYRIYIRNTISTLVEVTEFSNEFIKIKIPDNISNGSIIIRYDVDSEIYAGEFIFITYLDDYLTGYATANSMNDFLGQWMDDTDINQDGIYHSSYNGAISGEFNIDGSLESRIYVKVALPYSLDGYLYCTITNYSNVDSIIFEGDASILVDFDQDHYFPGQYEGEWNNYEVTKYVKYARLYSDFNLPITIIKKDRTIKDILKIALHRSKDLLRETDVSKCYLYSSNLKNAYVYDIEN